jgi:4-carboxymuconolactone decarboxylase
MAITEKSKAYHEKMFPGYVSKFLETDPEFIERFDNFAFDEVVNHDDLDDRTGLTYQQREMITFCFLAAQGGCEPQLTSHAAANMRLGNDQVLLIKVVSQCLPFIGYPRSLNALNCVNAAAEQIEK